MLKGEAGIEVDFFKKGGREDFHINRMLRASWKGKGDTGQRERKINGARSQRSKQGRDPKPRWKD